MNTQFHIFGPNPTPPPCVVEHAVLLPPPCHQPALTTPKHHPRPLFYMARLKPSYEHSVSGCWPKPHPWPCIGKCTAPPWPPCHKPTLTTTQHHPMPPFHMACPKLCYEHSVLNFWPTPHLASHWQMCSPPSQLLVNLHPPPPIITPYCHFIWHTQNQAMNAQFQIFGPNPALWPRIGECAAPIAVAISFTENSTN